jgi:hypothetical protein
MATVLCKFVQTTIKQKTAATINEFGSMTKTAPASQNKKRGPIGPRFCRRCSLP